MIVNVNVKRANRKKGQVFLFFIFILTLTILSCKNENNKAGDAPSSSQEAAWLEDYSPSPFVWGYIDTMGSFVINPLFDDTRDFSNGLAAVNLHGKWGYINKEGKMVISNSYMTCGDFSEGLALVQGFDKKYHYIDSTGKKIFDCPGEECASFVGEFAVFAVNESFGVIDKKGNAVVPPRFRDLKFGAPGQFIAKIGNQEGVIGLQANWIIEAGSHSIKLAGEGYYIVKDGQQSSYFDTKGKKVAGPYNTAGVFEHGYAAVKKDNKYEVLDKTMKTIYSTSKKLTSAGSGLWIEWQNDTTGLIIYNDGRYLTKKPYAAFLKFAEGTIGVMQGESWGYLDSNGAEMVSPSLPLAWDCIGGRIRFIGQSGYGFLDREGKVKIIPKFPEARDFKEGLARAAIFR